MVGEVGEVVTKHHHSGACFTAMSALKLPTVHDMIHPSGLLPTTVIPLAKLGCTTAQAGHHDLPEILEILVAHDFGCPKFLVSRGPKMVATGTRARWNDESEYHRSV